MSELEDSLEGASVSRMSIRGSEERMESGWTCRRIGTNTLGCNGQQALRVPMELSLKNEFLDMKTT